MNAYLRELSGYDFTAKDFRTWAGTVRTVTVLRELEEPFTARERKQRLVHAIKFVAADLCNTPAVCRSSYIHPAVIAAYEAGAFERAVAEFGTGSFPSSATGLPEEQMAMAVLPRLEADFGSE